MNNITDVILKLPAIIYVSIETHRNQPELFPIKEITYHLQMGFYWLKAANTELQKYDSSIVLSEGENEVTEFTVPTLGTIPDCLKYMTDNLIELSNEMQEYIQDTALPESVKYKVERAYDNTMMSLFNTNLSTIYYGQLTKQRQ